MNWSPSTYLTIDKAIIAFRSRINHKVKMKNKPISEGYKIWIAAEHGYTLTWLWHSKQDGPEGIPENRMQVPIGSSKSVFLAPTFALIIHIARILRTAYPT